MAVVGPVAPVVAQAAAPTPRAAAAPGAGATAAPGAGATAGGDWGALWGHLGVEHLGAHLGAHLGGGWHCCWFCWQDILVGAEGETDSRSDQHRETSLPLPEILESFLIHAFK